jgi:chromatin remodeling complex protein RSC6
MPMATTPKTAKPAAANAAPKAKAAADPNAPKKMDALQKPLTPSPELAEIVGKDMLPRGQVVSKVWDYIRAHNLQKPTDKRVIVADAKLKKVFGVEECTMFEMNKYLAKHLK